MKPAIYPSDVIVSASPWVSGARAAAYFGPVVVNGTIDNFGELAKQYRELVCQMQQRTIELGGNYIVGLEVAIDMCAAPMTIYMVGTVALLEPLWPE